MKFLKILGISLAVLLLLFVLVALFLPRTAVLERQITVDAPAQAFNKAILQLYEEHLWPIWDHGDSALVFTPLAEEEQAYSWQGAKAGYGECRYYIAEDKSIRDLIHFRGKEVAKSIWTFEGSEPLTINYRLSINAEKNLGMRWTNLFLRSLAAPAIDAVLAELKSSLEEE